MSYYGAVPRGAYRQRPKQNPNSLGFERYALGFGGANHVDLGLPASLQMGTGIITVEQFIKVKASAEYQYLFFGGGGGGGKGYGLALYRGARDVWYEVYGTLGGRQAFRVNIGIPDFEWCQVVAVFDGVGNRMKAYLDTAKKDDRAIADPGVVTNTSNFYLGAHRGSSSWLTGGQIALTRVYNCELLPDEISWNRLNYHNPVQHNLVLWLPTDEGAGLTVYDKSGHGNNGSLLPVATPPTWERVKQWELRAETE